MKKRDNIKHWVLGKKKSVVDQSTDTIQRVPSGACPEPNMQIDSDNSGVGEKTTFSANGNLFTIDSRYSYLKTLGFGAYGIVCAAHDSVSRKEVAVKKVQKVFDDLTDAKRIIRETRLLRSLNHPNILKILDFDEPQDYATYNDVYLITELMDSDLSKVLRSNFALLDVQRQYFAYQLLKALKYIHRDLKPGNILVSAACDLKICDLGLARFVDVSEANSFQMTDYVVTRWYRAPELLLAYGEYAAAIDMWSVGCILAELYLRKPIFPGTDVRNQLEVICKILGKPTPEEISKIPNKRARDFISSLPAYKKVDLRVELSEADAVAVNLIEGLLKFDSTKRLTAEDALQHAYVVEYRDKGSETVASQGELENLEPPSEKKLGREGIRRLLWDEMLKFRPDARDREPAQAREAEAKVQRLETNR